MINSIINILTGKFGRVALFGSLGLLLSISVFSGIQTWRLGNAHVNITRLEQVISAKDALITQLNDRIISDSSKIQQRDALIQEQNAAVVRITTEAIQNEKNYKARLENARKRNQGLERQISQIQQIPDQTNLSDEEVLQIIRDTIREYQESRR